MANQIVNAAPMVIDYGTQDLSTRLLPREPELIPQHLPKFYLFAQKGPSEEQLVVGNVRDQMYGTESFNLRSKFANHSTVFANLVNAEGNACMIKRVIPEDAGPEASIVAWLDVLPTKVDLYERNTDGSIKTDALGQPIVLGQTDGYNVKWVITNHANAAEMQNFGQLNIVPGDQVDTLTSIQSQRYPMFELKASSQGSYGNSCGIRLFAPTIDTVSSMPTKMMSANNAYPYFIQSIRRPDVLSSPKVIETLFGEQKSMVTFKKDVIDPLTDKQLYIGDTFIDSFQNLTDLRYAKLYGDFSDLKVYNDNIEFLVTKFHEAEIPHLGAFSDFTTNPDEKHLFNFVTGVSSYNVPYHSFIFVDSVVTTRFSEYTNVYANGGSDGTLDDVTHARLVKNEATRYLYPNDQLQELPD